MGLRLCYTCICCFCVLRYKVQYNKIKLCKKKIVASTLKLKLKHQFRKKEYILENNILYVKYYLIIEQLKDNILIFRKYSFLKLGNINYI